MKPVNIETQAKITRREAMLGTSGLLAAIGLATSVPLVLISPAIAQSAEQASAYPPSELTERAIERRAVEAAIWGMPIVSVDAMRQAFFRDAKAKYGDIVYWSKPSDWKNQTTTPNASNFYVYFNFNLKDGPVVLEFPAAVGAGLYGSMMDAWQVPIAEVGPQGEDRGKGGKYLLLPPDFKGDLPAGYFAIHSTTYNGHALFRAIPVTLADADVANALALVKQQRLYPLSQAANPPQQRHIDMVGKLFDGIVRYDDTFYDSLALMINEEPVHERDMVAMGQLRTLGIEKGKKFKPDTATRAILKKAVAEAQSVFIDYLTAHLIPFWPGSQWGLSIAIGPKTAFTFETDTYLDVDERGAMYFNAYAPPMKLGAGTFYMPTFNDASGQRLDGEKFYRLHVPPNVPAKQFWAVTVYDLETSGFIRDAPRISLDSYNQKMQRNPDGSVDIYFGPNAPAGNESNWIYTASGRAWFPYFRFYAPEQALFDKTWKLPDIEQMKAN
jgi:hypothetical protein